MEQIEEILIKAIEKVTDLKVEEKDENLFGYHYELGPRQMVYVILEVEKQLGKPIAQIFASEDIGIMTVNHLVEAIDKEMNKLSETIS